MLTSTGTRTGTFTGTAPTGYTLVYGTNTVDLQHQADQSFTLTSPLVTPRALVSTTVSLGGTLTNTAPIGSAALAVALSSTGTLTVDTFTSSTGATVSVGTPSTIGGTIHTGVSAGTIGWQVTNTDAGAVTSPVNINGSINVLNQRTFSSPTTYDFGRVLLGSSLNSGTLNVTTSGLHAVTADSTLAAYSGSAINGLSASGAATLADGSSSPFNIGRTISGTLSGTAGTLTGTFNMDATDEFSNTITNAANVSYTVNGVNQRTFSSPTTYDFGRVLLGSSLNSGTLNVTTSGLHAVTADSTLAAYSGSAINGLSASGAATLADGSSSPFNIGRTISGTLSGTAGTLTGTFNMDATDEFSNTITNAANVSYTVNGVNQRTFSSPTTYDFGRVLLGSSLNSGTLNVTTSGLHAVTADSTLAAYSGSAINGLSASGAATLADGSSSPFNIGRTISGTLSGTAGTLTGTFNMDATDEFSNTITNAANVSYTVNGVNQRTITDGVSTILGRVLNGTAVNVTSNAFTTIGLNATTTSVQVAGNPLSGSPDANGITLSGSATNFTGLVLNESATRTFGGTFTGTGVQTGSFTLGVTTLENGGLGLTGETAYGNVTVAYSANVLNQRTFSSPTTYDFGRVLLGSSLNSGTLNVTTSGLHAVTADSTLAAYSGSAINGLSASGAATLADGSSSPFNIGRTISGTLSGTAGTLTGTFNMDATDEFSNTITNAANVSYTVNGVNQRTFTDGVELDEPWASRSTGRGQRDVQRAHRGDGWTRPDELTACRCGQRAERTARCRWHRPERFCDELRRLRR